MNIDTMKNSELIQEIYKLSGRIAELEKIVDETGGELTRILKEKGLENAHLLAAARDAKDVIQLFSRPSENHERRGKDGHICNGCGFNYPCDTIKAREVLVILEKAGV